MTPNHDFLDNSTLTISHQKMLREIANDDLTPKKRDSAEETEFFENQTLQNHFMSKNPSDALINKI